MSAVPQYTRPKLRQTGINAFPHPLAIGLGGVLGPATLMVGVQQTTDHRLELDAVVIPSNAPDQVIQQARFVAWAQRYESNRRAAYEPETCQIAGAPGIVEPAK